LKARACIAGATLIAAAAAGPAPVPAPAGGGGTIPPPPAARRDLLVKLRPEAGEARTAAAHRRAGGAVRYASRITRWQVVRLPEGADPDEALRRYRSDPSVEAAERSSTYRIAKKPNDLKKHQWAFDNTGQQIPVCSDAFGEFPCPARRADFFEAGAFDADIDAVEAWDLATGSKGVVVAVLDTGVDLTRGDLSPRLVPGYDFANDDASPDDDHGHGTAVAAIVGAVGNNDSGMTGLNWKVSLMPVKVCDALGGCTTADILAGIDFAALNGAHVINMSLSCDQNLAPTWGCFGELPSDPCFSQATEDLIRAAGADGVVVVDAAGNCGSVLDDPTAAYPCAYDLPNNICVGATTIDDLGAAFGNVGPQTVEIGAPGQTILSYVVSPPGGFFFVDGTSFASPMVAGTAALLLSRADLTPAAVRERIVSGGEDPQGPLLKFAFQGGRLNAHNAIRDVFLRAVPYPGAGPAGTSVLLADVDRDGQAELIRGQAGTGFQVTQANVKRGRGSSTVWAAADPASVNLAGDVDGDGRADVLLWDAGSGVRVLRSTGSSFGAQETWSAAAPGTLNAAGDVTGDGIADLMRHAGTFEVLVSTGGQAGGFRAPATWSGDPAGDAAALADVSGDGRADLVIWTGSGPQGLVDVGVSTGTAFAASTRWIDGNPLDPNGVLEFAAAGDFDGDGRDDLLGYDTASGCLMVLVSTGAAFEEARPWACAGAAPILLAGRIDPSRDARADVLVGDGGSGWWFYQSAR
jgi:thermitase